MQAAKCAWIEFEMSFFGQLTIFMHCHEANLITHLSWWRINIMLVTDKNRSNTWIRHEWLLWHNNGIHWHAGGRSAITSNANSHLYSIIMHIWIFFHQNFQSSFFHQTISIFTSNTEKLKKKLNDDSFAFTFNLSMDSSSCYTNITISTHMQNSIRRSNILVYDSFFFFFL